MDKKRTHFIFSVFVISLIAVSSVTLNRPRKSRFTLYDVSTFICAYVYRFLPFLVELGVAAVGCALAIGLFASWLSRSLARASAFSARNRSCPISLSKP
jgi:hypothetical protein